MKKNIVIAFLSTALVISVGLNIYLLKTNTEIENDISNVAIDLEKLKNFHEEQLTKANTTLSESETEISNLEQKVADYEKQEQERLEVERKAREEEVARKAAEEVDKKNQSGGSYKAEEPMKQDPPSGGENPEGNSSSNNSGGSSSGGGRLGGLSGLRDTNGNGSIGIKP